MESNEVLVGKSSNKSEPQTGHESHALHQLCYPHGRINQFTSEFNL